MYEIRIPILHFFLLILEVLFNPTLDVIYKPNRFSKNLLKKSLEFVLDEKSSLILFFLSLVLLPSRIDLILKEQSHKKDGFKV